MTIARGEPMLATDILNLTFFPKGAILTFSSAAWSATSAEFKNIWKVCNAANHAADPTIPDLTNMFLRGAESSGAIGGADSVTLTTNNLPSHNHGATGLSLSGLSTSSLTITTSGGHPHSGSGTTNSGSGVHWHNVSGSAKSGGSHAHDIKTYQDDWNAEGGAKGNASWGSDNGTYAAYKSTEYGGSHAHDITGTTPVGEGGHSHDVNVSIPESGSHSHTISGSITGGTIGGSTADAGSGEEFTIVPSYYTVIYIMKAV